jgi:hypothetical protein
MLDDEILISTLTTIGTTVATLVIGWLIIGKRVFTELVGEFQKELRTARLKAYRELWGNMKYLAVYSPPEEIDEELLKTMSRELREWYFEHGLFLSGDCRDFYFTL